MSGLVLSIFPGLDVLGMGFEAEGFCVVRGPDVLWGGDIRGWHPPEGVFDGVIGGDPCQSHSTLANLVRAKGLEPRFGDLSVEYQRIIEEARPRWFLRENVGRAPDVAPAGYYVHSFLLDNSWLPAGDGWLGEEQMRRRRFWYGRRDGRTTDLRRWFSFAALEAPSTVGAVLGKETGSAPFGPGLPRGKRASVTGRHHSNGMGPAHPGNPPKYGLEEMLDLQGLPADLFRESPFTMEAKRKLVGNAVPLGMARALARAVIEADGG